MGEFTGGSNVQEDEPKVKLLPLELDVAFDNMKDMIGDLAEVQTLVAPEFPPSWEIFKFYFEKYNYHVGTLYLRFVKGEKEPGLQDAVHCVHFLTWYESNIGRITLITLIPLRTRITLITLIPLITRISLITLIPLITHISLITRISRIYPRYEDNIRPLFPDDEEPVACAEIKAHIDMFLDLYLNQARNKIMVWVNNILKSEQTAKPDMDHEVP